MLTSISPVGEAARQQRWSTTVAAYTVGSLVAGVAVGALLGLLGSAAPIPSDWAPWLLAGGGVVGLLADATTGVPTLHRQVDRRWLDTYRGWVYGLGFGVQLGTGVATIVPSSVVWLLWLGAAITADPLTGGLIGGVFGLLRALPVVAAGVTRSPQALRRTMRRMAALRVPAARAVTAGQATVSVLAILVAVT